MRISKEPSGGRGEYEWCDFRPDDPDPKILADRRIHVRLPSGIAFDTGTIFGLQGGKQRVRLAIDMAGQRELYPHWHAAAALMLPRPSRDETSWRAGSPIMRNGEYGIIHLHIGAIDVNHEGIAIVEVVRVEAANQSGQQEFAFNERFADVRRICQQAHRFDDEIRCLLEQHLQLLDSGRPLSPEGRYVKQMKDQRDSLSQ